TCARPQSSGGPLPPSPFADDRRLPRPFSAPLFAVLPLLVLPSAVSAARPLRQPSVWQLFPAAAALPVASFRVPRVPVPPSFAVPPPDACVPQPRELRSLQSASSLQIGSGRETQPVLLQSFEVFPENLLARVGSGRPPATR